MSTPFKFLTAISHLISKRADAVLAVFVVSVIFMMIMPLPTWLVDVLIALNISLSALVMVLSLYLPGPLAFSTFPAFLLITTLFRLALSVTTTRLILLQGDAGQIVEAFGEFVVGGNLVVGLVIFLILLIVNFLVITKGSERVAEVAARFTLDAMPGKQMSIDSDLRAGLLDELEAIKKRKSLSKESQLFGAMDGAMKFVKGDAIAGIIIVLVNILGGFSIGVLQQGLPGDEAIKLYTILTIGDGLVAQIPTLLIALTAGMIITRVKDDVLDTANVGQDLSKELSSEPKALILASGVLFTFGLIPGMPTKAFVFLALLLLTVGWIKLFLVKKNKEYVETDKEAKAQLKMGSQDANSFDTFEQICFTMHTDHEDSAFFDEVMTTMRKNRNNVVTQGGFILPRLHYRFEDGEDKNLLTLRFYEIPQVVCTVDKSIVAVHKEYEQKLNELSIEWTPGLESRSESDYLWVSVSDGKTLIEKGVPLKTCFDLLGSKAKKAFLQHGYQFIGIEEAKKISNWIEGTCPELKNELEKVIPLAQLADIIKNLMQETVSLKSLRKIIETIVAAGEHEKDTQMLTENVRVALKGQICNQITKDQKLSILMLEPEIEEYLRSALRQTASGSFFAITQDESDLLIENLTSVATAPIDNNEAVALVVAQDIRPHLRSLIQSQLFELPVLSFMELSETLKVTPLARISMYA